MTAACESECMPERRALVRYFYTINVFMYNDLGPSAGSRTETCPESKLTLYIYHDIYIYATLEIYVGLCMGVRALEAGWRVSGTCCTPEKVHNEQQFQTSAFMTTALRVTQQLPISTNHCTQMHVAYMPHVIHCLCASHCVAQRGLVL